MLPKHLLRLCYVTDSPRSKYIKLHSIANLKLKSNRFILIRKGITLLRISRATALHWYPKVITLLWISRATALHWYPIVITLLWTSSATALHWYQQVITLLWISRATALHWYRQIITLLWISRATALHWYRQVITLLWLSRATALLWYRQIITLLWIARPTALHWSLISSHLSLNREGRLGITDDFPASFLHFPLFSTDLCDLANSRPVHSLMLSSHYFLWLLYLLPISLCLSRWFRPDLMNGRHDHTMWYGSKGPIACWILTQTSSSGKAEQ